jgi:hypothetical protein
MSNNNNMSKLFGKAAEDCVDDYLAEHTIYDLFKCSMCGVSWTDHNSTCFYDHKKKYFDELRVIASSMEKHKSVFEVAKRNGFIESTFLVNISNGESI